MARQHGLFRGAGGALPVLLVFGSLWVVFLLVLHPWFMNWGATAEERAMVLPGDTAAPSAYFTRAITIDAPPSEVWPWLVQIGQDRAGFYSNDWLENLAGADIHNADELRPEWQQRAVGDKVPMAGPLLRELGGEATLLTVRLLEPGRAIADLPGRFVLVGENRRTRLLLREALEIPERRGLGWVVWDPVHFVMEARMLRGIKERAEGAPLVAPAVQVVARAGWLIAGGGLLGLFLVRRGWRPWLVLPVGAATPAIWLAGDLDGGLAGFLSVGITLAGVLRFGRRWWPPYLLLASMVALVLLAAPDPHTVFGIGLGVTAVLGVAGIARRAGPASRQDGQARVAAISRV